MLVQREKLLEGVWFNSVFNDKFKENLLTFRFIVPLKQRSVAGYAVVPYLLTISNKKYDNIVKLNRYLCELYGVELSVKEEKIGSYQVITLSMSYVDGKYIIDNDNYLAECYALISSILIEPNIIDGKFKDIDVNIAKDVILDKIDFRANDKYIYAKDRCNEIMFEGEDLALSKYGTKKDVEELLSEDLVNAYYNLIHKSKIEITYIGSDNVKRVKDMCKKIFKARNTDYSFKIKFVPSIVKNEVATVEEILDLSQSKVMIGLKCDKQNVDLKDIREYIVMNTIYGGSPFSRLFVNIRENMSLCYSCGSTYDRFSNSVVISMGIDHRNKNKAIDEVLNQLNDVQMGNFDIEDVDKAKLIIKNNYCQIKDSINGIDKWYFKQGLLNYYYSIDEEIKLLYNVTKEQIVEAAQSLKLDTIYSLRGDEDSYA